MLLSTVNREIKRGRNDDAKCIRKTIIAGISLYLISKNVRNKLK